MDGLHLEKSVPFVVVVKNVLQEIYLALAVAVEIKVAWLLAVPVLFRLHYIEVGVVDQIDNLDHLNQVHFLSLEIFIEGEFDAWLALPEMLVYCHFVDLFDEDCLVGDAALVGKFQSE